MGRFRFKLVTVLLVTFQTSMSDRNAGNVGFGLCSGGSHLDGRSRDGIHTLELGHAAAINLLGREEDENAWHRHNQRPHFNHRQHGHATDQPHRGRTPRVHFTDQDETTAMKQIM